MEEPTQGWTSSDDGRGTINIIMSAGATILLCSWTALCLNVPPPEWNTWRMLYQKSLMAGFSLVGPECVLQLAISQWAGARRSVKAFKKAGIPGWTLKHAFLAEMGGFALQPKDGHLPCMNGRNYFSLNAEQVLYLVRHGYIAIDEVLLDTKHIEDKNKGDGLSRAFAVCQMLWFTISTISRRIEGLAITLLEMLALGFAVETFGIYYFWRNKPLDVRNPILLSPEVPLGKILEDAGRTPEQPYDRTPLDFAADHFSPTNYYLHYGLSLLNLLRIPFARPKVKPWPKIPDNHFPNIHGWEKVILFIMHGLYLVVHLAAWNFYFPTRSEKILWHVLSVVMGVSGSFFWWAELFGFMLTPYFKKHERTGRADTSTVGRRHVVGLRQSLHALGDWARGLAPPLLPPWEPTRLKILLPVATFTNLYILARIGIVIEAIISLRMLPASAYKDLEWSSFWPHI